MNTFRNKVHRVHKVGYISYKHNHHGKTYTQLKKSDSYLRFYSFPSVLIRICFKSIPNLQVNLKLGINYI